MRGIPSRAAGGLWNGRLRREERRGFRPDPSAPRTPRPTVIRRFAGGNPGLHAALTDVVKYTGRVAEFVGTRVVNAAGAHDRSHQTLFHARVPVSGFTGAAPVVRYEIRRTDPSEAKSEILCLWRRNFQGLPEGRYAWIYESNPSGRATCWLAVEADSGTVVGSTALFPRRFTIRGEPRVAGVAADFSVDSRHRGFGPALALQNPAVSCCAPSGFSFLYRGSTSKST